MKIAFVYDRVNKWGGAERVLLTLHEIWPEAPLFTAVYNSPTASWAKVFKVVPSFLQYLPFAKSNHEFFPLLMPLVFESFTFDGFDVIISITSEAGKGIITRPDQLHLCYCLTPTRYLWSAHEQYFSNRLLRLLSKPIINYLRSWDKIAAAKPDEYIAISKTVQARIKHYYCRESSVIYPPVEMEKFSIKKQEISIKANKYFLVVSRLVKYKRVDLVVDAFNQLGWKLKIIGTGREMKKLKRKAGRNIEFLGQLTDEELISYYQNCQALIFPQEEDFGIVPLEAQACGKPVIAFRAGGSTETIIEGKTGFFFEKQTSSELIEILVKFDKNGRGANFDVLECHKQAEQFGKEQFKKKFKKVVEDLWKKHTKNIYTH